MTYLNRLYPLFVFSTHFKGHLVEVRQIKVRFLNNQLDITQLSSREIHLDNIIIWLSSLDGEAKPWPRVKKRKKGRIFKEREKRERSTEPPPLNTLTHKQTNNTSAHASQIISMKPTLVYLLELILNLCNSITNKRLI
jgi:hypothetical protein